ncbi:Ankyrin repeats (3 copies) [compost metagenome]
MLQAGVDIEATNAEGRTALMLAAHGGHTAVVHALSAAGADIDVRDARNWSALMIAAQAGQVPVVQALAHAGAGLCRQR